MELIQMDQIPRFDMSTIHPGDCIRFEFIGASLPRNGFVLRVSPERLTVCYSICTSNGTAIADILPGEVAAGRWRLWWTEDFTEIHTEGVTADDRGTSEAAVRG